MLHKWFWFVWTWILDFEIFKKECSSCKKKVSRVYWMAGNKPICDFCVSALEEEEQRRVQAFQREYEDRVDRDFELALERLRQGKIGMDGLIPEAADAAHAYYETEQASLYWQERTAQECPEFFNHEPCEEEEWEPREVNVGDGPGGFRIYE